MRVIKRVIFFAVLIYIAILTLSSKEFSLSDIFSDNYQQQDIASRENASINKEVSPYTVKKCGEVKHTDGTIMTICLGTFDGTTAGFYNPDKELMVVNSFSQYTLIHEITHATTLHYYKKGFTNMTAPEVQEKMAYNAENLLMQIVAFKEDINLTPDISNAKKLDLGIPITAQLAKK